MANLIISRKSEFMNWASEYEIYLNGQKIRKISSGETIELDIPEGTSIIKAKIKWVGSRELPISVTNGEPTFISVSGFKLPNIIVGLMTLLTLLLLTVGQQLKTDFPFLKWPVIIILSFLCIAYIYNLTIGRNKYIKIQENPKQT